jgi:uncharacterized protein (TIGR02001 family)
MHAQGDQPMRKYVIQSVVIGTGLLGLAAISQAATTNNTGLTANVEVTSNYVFRGQTQTDEDPAIQGGIDYTHQSGFYAGVWGSNVDFPGLGSGLEYDLYLGIGFDLNQDVKLDVGYITYQYTNNTVDNVRGTDEVFIGAKYKGFAGYYYYGNANYGNENYQYFDLRYTMDLPKEFKMTLHYGHLDPDNSHSADDVSVRVSRDFSGFIGSLSVTSIDSNDTYGNDKTRVFITVTKNFDL